MRDLKVLKSSLKGRRKIVEALLVVFMITGSIQSFGTDIMGTDGEDELDIVEDMTGDVFGDVSTGDMSTGSNDTITIREGVTISFDMSYVDSDITGYYDGNIYGEYATGDLGTGGDDQILLEKGAIVLRNISGEVVREGNLTKGGNDTITLTDGASAEEIYGEYLQGRASIKGGTLIKGGNDTITLTDGASAEEIYGEFVHGTIEQGGNDTITIDNDGWARDIYGECVYDSVTEGIIEEGGDDNITVDNSTMGYDETEGIIYGEYMYSVHSLGTGGTGGTIEQGGDDTIIVQKGSAIGGIYGEYMEADKGNPLIKKGGDDNITISDSSIGGSVYGEYTYNYDTMEAGGTIEEGGDDTFILIGTATIGGIVSGGRDGSGIVAGRESRNSEEAGDYDTLNLSAYTTDFTTLNYEGIEEVNLVDNTNIDLGDGPYTSNESVIFNVESGSSIKADNGEYTMKTSLSNSGTINLIGDYEDVTGDKFIVDGDFSGDGGVIDLDMNAMDLTSDMIVVKGDFTGTQLINPTIHDTDSGTTFIPKTVSFMEVEGSNTGEVGFASVSRSSGMITKGRISGSAFEWEVNNKDMSSGSNMWSISTVQGVDATLPLAPERPSSTTDPSTPDGGGSTGGGDIVVLPELPAYASLQNIGEDMIHSNVDSLYTRLGDIRRYKAENEGESLTKDKVIQDDDYMELSRDGVTVWTRATAEYFDYEANGDAYGYDGDVSGFDIGADYTFELSRDTAVVAGLLYGKRYGNFETSTSDEGKYVVAESADIDMDSWSLAAYGTFIYKDNTYLDLVAGYTDYESDIDALGLNDSVDGDAIWGSAEVGHSFQVGDIWRVEPQLQVTYTEVDFDDTTNDVGTEVEYTSNNQLTGRIGTIVSAGIPINEAAQVRPWFGVSVLQEFMDPEDVTYGGTDFEGQDIDTYMEYKLGVQLDLNEAVGMYVEGKYQTDYDDYDSYRGTLGMKYSF